MTKLFIDIVGLHEQRIDCKGHLFSHIDEARESALLLSMDLAIPEDSRWIGAEVQLKDEIGTCLGKYAVSPIH